MIVLSLISGGMLTSCSGEELPPQTEKPEEEKDDKPGEGEEDKPGEGEEDKPGEGEEDKPGEGNDDKPEDPPQEDPKLDKTVADALAKNVDDNIVALQMLAAADCISSCVKTDESGKYTVTFTDGKTLNIDTSLSGLGLLTIIEDGDGYVWALMKDGKAEKIMAGGAAVPVGTTPKMQVTEKGEWQISTGEGAEWHSAGITIDVKTTKLDIELFKSVTMNEEKVDFTLIGGTVISLPVVGDGVIKAEETSIWFTKLNEKKEVKLTTYNVKTLTVTNVPDNWKAEISGNVLTITSASEITDVNKGGNVEVTAEFGGNGKTAVTSVEVQYDKELKLSADAYGLIKVEVSEHVAKDYPGYILKAWLTENFSTDAVISWLNGEGKSATPYSGTKEFNLADVAEGYVKGKGYTIFAISALSKEQIAGGTAKYEAADLQTAVYTPTDVFIDVTGIRFDHADVSVTYNGVTSYYAGISTASDWNNYVRKNFLEMLGWGGMTPLTSQSYSGDADSFPNGEKSLSIRPATEYTIWVLPFDEGGKYADGDFITKSFTTPDITSGAAFAAPSYTVTDLTYGGFTAKITPASGAYKTYAAILPASSLSADEKELVTTLVNGDRHSEGQSEITVSANNYDSNDEVYILAVSLDENGRYGSVLKEQVKLKQLEYSDEIGITDCDIAYGLGDVTLTLTFKGTPETITYSAASFTFYGDEEIQKMMAMGQFGDVIDKKISSLTEGRKIKFTGLELGTPYTFYAVVKDGNGNPSRMFTIKFTPNVGITYIMSTAENYSYGMPQVSGKWKNRTTYVLNVDKPGECVKFWMQVCDSEYLTGDVYTDSDKLITMTGYACEEHSESIVEKTYEYLNSNTRIFIAWLDNNGNYHAIHEIKLQ